MTVRQLNATHAYLSTSRCYSDAGNLSRCVIIVVVVRRRHGAFAPRPGRACETNHAMQSTAPIRARRVSPEVASSSSLKGLASEQPVNTFPVTNASSCRDELPTKAVSRRQVLPSVCDTTVPLRRVQTAMRSCDVAAAARTPIRVGRFLRADSLGSI